MQLPTESEQSGVFLATPSVAAEVQPCRFADGSEVAIESAHPDSRIVVHGIAPCHRVAFTMLDDAGIESRSTEFGKEIRFIEPDRPALGWRRNPFFTCRVAARFPGHSLRESATLGMGLAVVHLQFDVASTRWTPNSFFAAFRSLAWILAAVDAGERQRLRCRWRGAVLRYDRSRFHGYEKLVATAPQSSRVSLVAASNVVVDARIRYPSRRRKYPRP